jgi:hypothetical protein
MLKVGLINNGGPMKYITIIIVFFLMVFCTNSYLHADSFPDPKFELEKMEKKEFVVENVYTYYLMFYKQPLKVEVVNEQFAKFDTPEDAFISFVSSMNKLNHLWFVSCWDAVSADRYISTFNNKDKLSMYIDGWRTNFVGTDIFITKRVDRKKFVAIEFVVKKDGIEIIRSVSKFVNQDGKFKVTNLFSDDPIVNYLPSGKDRIIIPAELFQK